MVSIKYSVVKVYIVKSRIVQLKIMKLERHVTRHANNSRNGGNAIIIIIIMKATRKVKLHTLPFRPRFCLSGKNGENVFFRLKCRSDFAQSVIHLKQITFAHIQYIVHTHTSGERVDFLFLWIEFELFFSVLRYFLEKENLELGVYTEFKYGWL